MMHLGWRVVPTVIGLTLLSAGVTSCSGTSPAGSTNAETHQPGIAAEYVALSAAGMIAGHDRTVALFEAPEGSPVWQHRGSGRVVGVAGSRRSAWALEDVGSRRTVLVRIDTATGVVSQRRQVGRASHLVGVERGVWLAGTSDRLLRRFDNAGDLVMTVRLPPGGVVTDLAPASDGDSALVNLLDVEDTRCGPTWVCFGQVARVSRSGQVRTTRVGRGNAGVAASRRRVWVTHSFHGGSVRERRLWRFPDLDASAGDRMRPEGQALAITGTRSGVWLVLRDEKNLRSGQLVFWPENAPRPLAGRSVDVNGRVSLSARGPYLALATGGEARIISRDP